MPDLYESWDIIAIAADKKVGAQREAHRRKGVVDRVTELRRSRRQIGRRSVGHALQLRGTSKGEQQRPQKTCPRSKKTRQIHRTKLSANLPKSNGVMLGIAFCRACAIFKPPYDDFNHRTFERPQLALRHQVF
jgi:hypothetical protein